MGNLIGGHVINPGAVLDRVISQSSNDDDCLLYKLANYKKSGELIDAYNLGGGQEVEKLIREQFGILMYKDGKGQVISRTEYLRWKFRNVKHVVIPVEPANMFDPLGKWEDHDACWQMQYRGSLGETLLHLLIISDTRVHTKLAKILLRCFPRLAADVVEGEEYLGASALHLAIAYNNNDLVHLLVESGAYIEQRAIGSFFLPRDQQRIPPGKSTDYEGLAYLGEYPLAWAACVNNETVYNLLLDHDANPDNQDSFGNAILHMVVVTDQLGMYGYALRHPKTCASNNIINNQGLTPLTLACRLGRASVFREMLEQSCKEFWRYSNITCSAYPLNALDTILPDGKTNWNSALFMILAGSKEEHLDMLDGGIIQRLLEEKWKTFAQRQFLKRITIAFIHLIAMSMAVYLRPKDRTKDLREWVDATDIFRMIFELGTVGGCLSFVIVQQGEEIKNQGLFTFLRQLTHAPPKALFLVANLLILSCIPFRIHGDVLMEESLLAFTMVFSWFFMMFFAGAIKLTGPFVTMVYSMITGDMLTFGIIYGIFLLAFSQSFFYLYKGHPEQNGTLFAEFDMTWMAMYQMTLGSYNYNDLSALAYPNAAKTVFIIFMIMVPILLLNMLIAMMGNTYSQVIERSEKEWVKQWAKIVVTLERAVSQADAQQYIQEYSIKLSGTDLSNEVRGVMVIKSKSKTRAKQRKGAVANWKRVGKVTITALKKRHMTGEEMRQLMWGQRASICTPQNITPRQQSMEVDPNKVRNKEDPLAQLALINDLNFENPLNVPSNSIQIDNLAPLTTSTSLAPVDGSSPAKPIGVNSPPKLTSLPKSRSKPLTGNFQPPPDYDTAVSPPSYPVNANGTSAMGQKIRPRKPKIGLRPKIIIFSDKKDLIRVSLDSDESDGDICHVNYNHKFHVRSKSSRRRSIAGDSVNLTSSRESLAADTEVDEGQGADVSSSMTGPDGSKSQQVSKQVDGGGHVNPAYEPDAQSDPIPTKEPNNSSKISEIPKEASGKTPKKQVTVVEASKTESPPKHSTAKERPKSAKERPKSAKPKGKNGSETSGKKSTDSPKFENEGGADSFEDKGDNPSTSKPKKNNGPGRSKSAKSGHSINKVDPQSGGKNGGNGKKNNLNKDDEDISEEEEGGNDEPNGSSFKKTRPSTAMDRWSTKEVQNMNKLVAWDRPEDEI